jgi:hypothetical protein
MEKEFVPYEIALELKELGFDEECLKHYSLCGTYFDTWNNLNQHGIQFIGAPLYQQVFRWFREKYNITQTIARDGSLAKESHWAYTIVYDSIYFNDGYLTYEEAELECLKKLIEIVKNKP